MAAIVIVKADLDIARYAQYAFPLRGLFPFCSYALLLVFIKMNVLRSNMIVTMTNAVSIYAMVLFMNI